MENVKKDAKTNMEKALLALAEGLKKVRTGRAQISMLDNIRVNYYGTPTPLNQVSAVSTPDAKTFLIAPWEAQMLKEIEQAIVKSDVGMSPINDGKVIRLKLPSSPSNAERTRQNLPQSWSKTRKWRSAWLVAMPTKLLKRARRTKRSAKTITSAVRKKFKN